MISTAVAVFVATLSSQSGTMGRAMPTQHASRPRTDDIVHRGKDLRVPHTAPEQLAKALLSDGAKPRPETKRREVS